LGAIELRNLADRPFSFRLPQSLTEWPHQALAGCELCRGKSIENLEQTIAACLKLLLIAGAAARWEARHTGHSAVTSV
jgi:hypothetical protein